MTTIELTALAPLRPVAFDLYRDVHKGVRAELFALTASAGRLDPASDAGLADLVDHVRRTVQLLVEHAEHEDGAISPVLETVLPELAARIADDHDVIEERMDHLLALAAALPESSIRRAALHELYVELAAFTGSYLLHQDMEEREVMPALEEAVGLDGVLGIHGRIISNMPPQQLNFALAVMFPAMNVDDRTELLADMQANAPTEAFESVWSLARSVLDTPDHRAVATRLGL